VNPWMPPLIIALSDLSPAQLARHRDAFAVALRAEMTEVLTDVQLAAMAAGISVRQAEEDRVTALFRVLLDLAAAHAQYVIPGGTGDTLIFQDLAATTAANPRWTTEGRRVARRLSERLGRDVDLADHGAAGVVASPAAQMQDAPDPFAGLTRHRVPEEARGCALVLEAMPHEGGTPAQIAELLVRRGTDVGADVVEGRLRHLAWSAYARLPVVGRIQVRSPRVETHGDPPFYKLTVHGQILRRLSLDEMTAALEREEVWIGPTEPDAEGVELPELRRAHG
jgi:hypothetical protein